MSGKPVEVRMPDEPPELTPQAARILLRILMQQQPTQDAEA